MTAPANSKATAALAIPVAIGAGIAIALGVYGKVHNPAGSALNISGFSSGRSAKSWLATIVFVLAIVQVASAFVMYGKSPIKNAPSWISPLHRWSGRLAMVVSVPVAAHCLYALGFDGTSGRVLVHSLLGCFFYGVFAAKMLLLTKPNLPSWALPVAGGVLFTAITGLWLSASLWFFTTFGWKL